MPYDPFLAGPFPARLKTLQLADQARGREFPTDVWYPDGSGRHPLVVFSHYSGGHRRTSTFLLKHLASHGYVVAAMDHSEVVAPELRRPGSESPEDRGRRIDAIIASRVPDIQFLLDELPGQGWDSTRVGLVGHSFGGWTVLATTEVDQRVRSVVALAPGGSSYVRPGILPLTLSFAWGRDVPTLYLAAELDVPVPLAGVQELFERTPASKRMFVLRNADHQHFLDDVEAAHEAMRTMPFPPEAAWIPAGMRPMTELASAEQAHVFVRGLTLAHLDATLKGSSAAERFLDRDVEAALEARGVSALSYPAASRAAS